MDRLAMPKRSMALVTAAGDVEALVKRPHAGVPPGGLPIWEKLPLDAKLPMMSSPKKAVVLYTTNLCEKIHVDNREHDFHLTDPDAHYMSNRYQPLHDPHLKHHLCQKRMKYRLYRGGFITKDGKVLCTLKEFNQYRQYLRRIHLEALSQERRKKDNELGRRKLLASAGNASLHAREVKVKEVRRRLREQYESDKERYKQIMLEHENRRERLKNERLEKMTEQERKRLLDRARREALLKKQELQESRRKMHMHRKWLIEDEMRRARAEKRRLEREIELQMKLEEAWKQRKLIQEKRLQDEEMVRQREENQRQRNISVREADIRRQRRKREAVFLKMQEQARREREKQEAICRKRLEKEIEKRRAEKKSDRKSRRLTSGLQSNWDLEMSIMKDMPKVVEEPLDRKYSVEELGLTDLRGARFSKECITTEEDIDSPQVSLTSLGLGEFRGANYDSHVVKAEPYVKPLKKKLRKVPKIKIKLGGAKKKVTIAPVEEMSPTSDEVENTCNFACLIIALSQQEVNGINDEHDITQEAPLVNKHIAHLQKEIRPKMSASSINLQLSYSADDSDSEASTTPTPPVDRRDRCLDNFQRAFMMAASKMAGDEEKLSGFVVEWTIITAQMTAWPGTPVETYLCPACEKDLRYAYCPLEAMEEPYSRPLSPIPTTSGGKWQTAVDGDDNEFMARRGVRFSIVEETIPILEAKPVGEIEEDDTPTEGSFINVKLRDSLTRLKEGHDSNTLDTLVKNLTKILQDLEARRLGTEEVNRLEQVTADILRGAATVASTVNEVAPENELLADAGKTRSALMIEAMIGQAMDEALSEMRRADEAHKTTSELIGDLVGYTLNEAVDDTKNIDAERLAKHDSMIVGKHLEDILQKALDDMENRRMSSECILLSGIISDTMNKVMADIKYSLLPPGALENLAMSIVRSHDTVKHVRSDMDDKSFKIHVTSLKATEFVRTPLVKVLEDLENGFYSGQQIAEMADKVCASVYELQGEGGAFKRLHSPSSVTVMTSFIKDVIGDCLNHLNDETAEQIVTRMLSEAALSSKSSSAMDNFVKRVTTSATNAVQESTEFSRDSRHALETFVHNIINTSLTQTNMNSERATFIAGFVSETVIKGFVEFVLSGSLTNMSAADKLLDRKPSVTNLVLDSFVKRILDYAMQHCRQRENDEVSLADSRSEIIENYVHEMIFRSRNLEEISNSEESLIKLAKDISGAVVSTAGKRSKEGPSKEMSAEKNIIFSDEESASEEEVPEAEPLEVTIQPVLKNKIIDINPEKIVPCLSAISMRPSLPGHLTQRLEATHRNSFCNLMRPELSRVKGLRQGSTEEVKNKLNEVYKQSMSRLSTDKTVVVPEREHHHHHHTDQDEEPEEGHCSSSESSADEDDEPADEVITVLENTSATTYDKPSPTVDLKNSSPARSPSSKDKTTTPSTDVTIDKVGPVKMEGSSSTRVTCVPSTNEKSGTKTTRVKEINSRPSNTSTPSASAARKSSDTSKTSLLKSSSSNRSKTSKTKIAPKSSTSNHTKRTSPKTSKTKPSGSGFKLDKQRSKPSVRVTKTPSRSHSHEIEKVSPSTCDMLKKTSVKSLGTPTHSGIKLVKQEAMKKSSENVVISPKSSGKVGPAETGSIHELRAQKELKKALSGQVMKIDTEGSSPAPPRSSASNPQAETESDQVTPVVQSTSICETAGKTLPPGRITPTGRKTPSDSLLTTGRVSPVGHEVPTSRTETNRVLSDGEVVQVKSLYGSFSSKIQVRSSTELLKSSSSSGNKIDVKEPNASVKAEQTPSTSKK